MKVAVLDSSGATTYLDAQQYGLLAIARTPYQQWGVFHVRAQAPLVAYLSSEEAFSVARYIAQHADPALLESSDAAAIVTDSEFVQVILDAVSTCGRTASASEEARAQFAPNANTPN